ncbi:MFS transporter [Brevibacterium casei]|uniref:MFS transporter, ACS family, D-galactonate transporter n=2 Tax=Brevibacterium casei TaxID=33889 RepID=A0A2H1JTW5_9MICO|nr:MFS transporter [Brevibacterium casei]QPR39964.1 MFS transporter [Brevibacterium casei]QPR44128.1 MFS transporter [Brevibacterium casei]QPS32332.1 MFS transporter [Brevibacterium casei]SMX90909.1 MFS transporter, ACS family, D-galactonate transporter [Brevibacterium casei CIP 102111]
MSKLTAVTHARPTRMRYIIAILLFITVVINYMDRANLSIAMPALSDELNLTTGQQGLLLSAFGWTYAVMQLPGGWLVDRIRPRVLYASCLVLWSLATLFMGMAGGFAALIILRLLVGGFEAPAYPINNKVATTWFPESERGRVIAFYTSGQFIGLALLTPVLSWLQTVLTWHWVFILTGVVGIVWAGIWWLVYREPRDKSGINQAEIDFISAGGGLVDADRSTSQKAKPKLSWADIAVVLSKRKLWGIYIGQFCLTSTLWFFLTWFPTYLVDYRGMDYVQSGFMASLPFIAALVGVLLSGWVSDFMVKRGRSLGAARKIPIITGLALTVFMLGANFTDSSGLVIVFMSIAFFGNGFASITWSLVSALAPARLLGLTGGMFNFIGNLSSIATPIVIGFLVSATDFAPAFVYMAVVTLVGVLSYIFLVGRVERVEE